MSLLLLSVQDMCQMEHIKVFIFEILFQCPLSTSEGCSEAPMGRHAWRPPGDNVLLSAVQDGACIALDGSQWISRDPRGPPWVDPCPALIGMVTATGSSLYESRHPEMALTHCPLKGQPPVLPAAPPSVKCHESQGISSRLVLTSSPRDRFLDPKCVL